MDLLNYCYSTYNCISIPKHELYGGSECIPGTIRNLQYSRDCSISRYEIRSIFSSTQDTRRGYKKKKIIFLGSLEHTNSHRHPRLSIQVQGVHMYTRPYYPP